MFGGLGPVFEHHLHPPKTNMVQPSANHVLLGGILGACHFQEANLLLVSESVTDPTLAKRKHIFTSVRWGKGIWDSLRIWELQKYGVGGIALLIACCLWKKKRVSGIPKFSKPTQQSIWVGSDLNLVFGFKEIYHLESRWRNSHVLVYHGPLLSDLLGVAPSTFTMVYSILLQFKCCFPKKQQIQWVLPEWHSLWGLMHQFFWTHPETHKGTTRKSQLLKTKKGLKPLKEDNIIPSRKLTYPTLGKGKSSSKVIFDGICQFPVGYLSSFCHPFFRATSFHAVLFNS